MPASDYTIYSRQSCCCSHTWGRAFLRATVIVRVCNVIRYRTFIMEDWDKTFKWFTTMVIKWAEWVAWGDSTGWTGPYSIGYGPHIPGPLAASARLHVPGLGPWDPIPGPVCRYQGPRKPNSFCCAPITGIRAPRALWCLYPALCAGIRPLAALHTASNGQGYSLQDSPQTHRPDNKVLGDGSGLQAGGWVPLIYNMLNQGCQT